MKNKKRGKAQSIERLLGEVGESHESLVEMMMLLIKTLEERDPYTSGHSERVSILSTMIGQKLGFSGERLELLRRGALLHDIGKIGIRDDLLYKPGNFSQDERARMNQHPEKGHFIILHSHRLWDLIPMVRNHHENFDGSGYPDGLKAEEIPIEARIVSLSDYFDALATARPYKQAYPKDECITFVQKMSGTKFDPKVVDAFLNIVNPFYEKHIESHDNSAKS